MKLMNFKTTDTFWKQEDGLNIEEGLIVANGSATSKEVYDCKGHYLFPGFFDLQLYGAAGYIFDSEPTMECLERISEEHERYGTTAFLITLPSTSLEKVEKAITVVREALRKGHTNVKGLHLEGPFLNPEKRGAHNLKYIQKPDNELLDRIMAHGKGVVKMMTIAPEMWSEGLLKRLETYDVKISLGHSNATYGLVKRAFELGIDCCTHLYNAMSPMESRAAGMVGACLGHEEVWATLVVDGKHVCYETLALTLKLKPSKLILISDATFLNVQESTTSIGGIEVYKVDGAFYTQDGKLAGSAIALSHAVENCIKELNVPLEIAVDMASARPASLLAMESQGVLRIGQKADLILLDPFGAIKAVMVAGVWKHRLVSN